MERILNLTSNNLFGVTFFECDIHWLVLRGCPHITSANFGGFQTPPPPLVSRRQHLADPPCINALKEFF